MLACALRRCGVTALALLLIGTATADAQSRPAMTTEAEFLHALEELSNWGRWGADDGLGAANLITPAKRKAAAALVTEGRSVSLAHDIIQAPELEGQWYLRPAGGQHQRDRRLRPLPVHRHLPTASSTATSTPSPAT